MLPLLLALAGGAKAIGALAQGQSSANAANYNADVAARDARIAVDQGEALVLQNQRAAYLAISRMRAGYGASGITASGSALDVLADSASQATLDTQNIRYSAQLKALGFNDTAALDRMRAKAAKNSSYLAAAGDLIGAGGNAYAAGAGTPIPVDTGNFGGADVGGVAPGSPY